MISFERLHFSKEILAKIKVRKLDTFLGENENERHDDDSRWQ